MHSMMREVFRGVVQAVFELLIDLTILRRLTQAFGNDERFFIPRSCSRNPEMIHKSFGKFQKNLKSWVGHSPSEIQ